MDTPAPPPPTHAPNGKFAPGNPLGGNRFAGAQQRFKSAMIRAAEEPDKDSQVTKFERIVKKVLDLAESGEEWAVKEMFNRVLGKVREAEDDDGPAIPGPAGISGDVTINSQTNNYVMSAEAEARLVSLMERGVKAIEADPLLNKD